jgi:hypothetical protein
MSSSSGEWCVVSLVKAATPVVFLAALGACGASTKTSAPPALPRASAVAATPAPRGQPTWLPSARNAEEGIIEGVPLISVEGADVVVDGLRIGDVGAIVAAGRPSRIDALFHALRARREAWLTTHPGEAWPGVVAYRFGRAVPAAVVKSVVLTAGYAACPSGSLLVETRGDSRSRVGRLAVYPLMVAEPDEKILTVEVKSDAFVLAWKDSRSAVPTKVVPRELATETHPVELPALAAEVAAMWEAAGIHRTPADPRVDQAIVHVDDAVPYEIVVAVLDAIYAPRRSMLVGKREARVPALNVTLAGD